MSESDTEEEKHNPQRTTVLCNSEPNRRVPSSASVLLSLSSKQPVLTVTHYFYSTIQHPSVSMLFPHGLLIALPWGRGSSLPTPPTTLPYLSPEGTREEKGFRRKQRKDSLFFPPFPRAGQVNYFPQGNKEGKAVLRPCCVCERGRHTQPVPWFILSLCFAKGDQNLRWNEQWSITPREDYVKENLKEQVSMGIRKKISTDWKTLSIYFK